MRTVKLHARSAVSLSGILLVLALTPVYAADLAVFVPAKSLEGYGVLSKAGKVNVPSALASDLVVELTSNDPSEVLVPETVTILAGETSVRFDLAIVDDDEVDGSQTAAITATASGWTSGICALTVMDNDPRHVSPALAGGGAHTLALQNDGKLWAWGSNGDGQLGDGTTASKIFPVRVASAVEAIDITAGRSAGEDGSFTVAACSDGTVRAWGVNHYGQLGDGTTTDRYTPLQVLNLDNVMATSGGTAHSLALKADGTIWAWGRNDRGQLGDGTTTNRTLPVQVSNLADVIAVDAGGSHSLALRGDGTVWAWGNNGSGQLGDGTTTNRTSPVQVADLGAVIAIGAGAYHSLAIRSDGSAWAWGLNYYGQLGDGSTTNRTTPVRVSDLSDVISVCSGMHYSVALKGDGTVRAWGVNWFGSLGDGTTTNSPFPVHVSDLTDVIAIDAGMYHALALKEDGTVWAWGLNEYNQLGDGTDTNRTTPVQVVGFGGVGFLNLIVENLAPFTPGNPTPANDEVGISVPDGSTTLTWSGGDPDPGDKIKYDVLHGTAGDSLSVVATDIDVSSYQVSGLNEGATYYWQVVSRDAAGLVTSGPVWRFTTLALPDLVVSSLSAAPAGNLVGGQTVTFTATIANTGTAPTSRPFQVGFQIDGADVTSQTVSPTLGIGESVQVAASWTAQSGDHTVGVVADSSGVVVESNEANNSLSIALPEVLDTVPPEVLSTSPADGALLKQPDRIVVTLRDLHGAVDDAAVIASFQVTKDGQPVPGSVTELNHVFTFTPQNSPLEDGLYHVSLAAADVAGNTLNYTFSFTVDRNAPAAPVITGGLVLTGLMEARPVQNASNTRQVTLTGTRDDETGVVIRLYNGSWIGNVLHVGEGQMFSTIQAAVEASEDGDTVLIEPGAYNECVRITKWVNLKGNTLDVVNNEVSINGTDDGNITFGITHDSPLGLPIYLEGLTLQTSGSANPTSGARLATRIEESDIQTTGSGKIVWNRCRFLTTSSVKYPFSDHTGGGASLEFENCYFERGYAHFLHMNQPWALKKAQLNDAYVADLSNTDPEPMDYVTVETLGYGPGQGTWYVEWDLSPVGEVRVDLGSGDWSVPLTLSEGANVLEVWAEDPAANRSPSVWVDILVDSVAPAVTATWPQDNAFINADPESVVIDFVEAVSGVDPDESLFSIEDSNQTPIEGTWSVSGNRLVFTPAGPLADSYYSIDVTLADQLGNRGAVSQFHFTLDTLSPEPPAINPVISPTYSRNQTISGTKESYASILLNGGEIVGHTAGTAWSHGATLQGGVNPFSFVSEDRAGNQSESVVVEIVYSDIPPLAVNTLTADGEGNGTTVRLSWAGYDESVHGDIASYRVYCETSGFTDVSGIAAMATLPAGTFACTAQNLTRGQTYWFAVVAVDAAGNALTSVSPIHAVPDDRLPPEPVTRLRLAGCFDDGLIFAWDPSADRHGDLAGYRVYFNNDPVGVSLPAGESGFQKTGLSPATAYPIRVTAFDGGGNESSGFTLTGITLLPDPANLTLAAYSGYVNLTWGGVSPSQYLKHYAVYVSTTGFDTVEGMSPYATTTSTSIKIAGLTNNAAYYFAVTSVNLSGGERKTVEPSPGTPIPDAVGPAITNVKVDNVLLTAGHTVRKSAAFTLNGSDPSGVSRVDFFIDGVLLRTDYNGSPSYDCYWNILTVPDGNHLLVITAYDTLGNATTAQYPLVVALDPPGPPNITYPLNGLVTGQAALTVRGTGEKGAEILLYNNGAQAAGPSAVDAAGLFSIPFTLSEGANRLKTAARNRGGTGPFGNEVLVTLDTALPPSPTNLTAQGREGGVIRLTWRAPSGGAIKGYHLYRAGTPFTSIAQAQKVNSTLLTVTTYDNLPSQDGTYFYRVTSVSNAGNESEPSGEASALSDRTMPRVVSAAYTPSGHYDPQTGRIAPGTVAVRLTLSEPLQATPFFSITPEGGVPLSLSLTKLSDLEYGGLFAITQATPTGTGYAVFSGRDLVGNRGTEIAAGGMVLIDTDGPSVSRILIEPESPIRNNDPVSIRVTIGLIEPMNPGDEPALTYLLSAEGRSPEPIQPLTQVTPQPGEAEAWQGVFTLPADAGLNEAETFHFTYTGADDLANVSQAILCPNLFQVYQGALPPLSPPLSLKAESLPGGAIRLTWSDVAGAVGYQVYRRAPGEAELAPLVRLGTVLTLTDTPSEDGTYGFAVSSIRQENSQESLSGMSEQVLAVSDGTPPNPPLNLTLQLVAQGIMATWQPPAFTEPVSYSLYRDDVSEITTVAGLTPLAGGINQTTVIDPHPSPTDHAYVVTAVDGVGNVSLPSNSFYHNFQLLPISSLTVLQVDEDAPVITWTHPGGSIAGYDFYLGSGASLLKVNESLLTARSHTDAGYAGDARRYTVIAVDTNGHESVGRSLTLPVLKATLSEGALVRRGVMNRLICAVENHEKGVTGPMQLKVRVAGRDHTTEPFTLGAGETRNVPVVVGGYPDLPDVASLTITMEVTPNAGEKASIVRNGEILVGDGMLVLQIFNEPFTRGGTGKVWFTLENTGEEEIEVLAARSAGASASNQVTYSLKDRDGNVISSKAFKQVLGQGIVTLSNGNTVARIGAGEVFTSGAMEIPVAASAPDDLTVALAISKIDFHQGRVDQVSMNGLSTTREVTLKETSYYGEIVSISPQSARGDQDIVIQGRAVGRETGLPMAGAPLDLVITVKGFSRTYKIFTDAEGSFSYPFKPLSGESGLYQVRAVHPDLLDRPVQGQFVINRVSVTPGTINLSVPKNYQKTIQIQVTAGEGTSANHLRLAYDPADQPAGAFAQGVHVTLGPQIALLGSGKSGTLSLTLWADNTASTTATLYLKVKSDETGDGAWGTVRVNAQFSEAQPVLYFTPNHVETGVALDGTVTETVTLKNTGLADLNHVTLSVVMPNGTPAPAWVHLNTSAALGAIPVGASRQVSVGFSPATGQASEGVYPFKLRVKSANYAQTDINLYVSVTQSGVGNVLFKVADIYTGTLGSNNQPIQGLAGAKITLQNEEVSTVQASRTSDSLGEAYITDLPAGRYKYRATANNHQERIGRIWIKPGITVNEEVFLDYNLVTVEWEVNEITIQDQYELILNATFETDVPAAVVVAEPTSVTIPSMKAGDVYHGEFTLTNYGLIRADNVKITLPQTDQSFRYELLSGLPEEIDAKARITVPFRVTCIRSLDQAEEGTGGGCYRYLKCARVDYGYTCANGVTTKATTQYCWTRTYGECGGTTSPPVTGGGGTWYVGGGTGSGSVSSTGPAPSQIQGVKCFPDPDRKESFYCPCDLKGSRESVFQPVLSAVNLVMREYHREDHDLSVRVPGGAIDVQRWYFGDTWRWEGKRHNLAFKLDALGQKIASIDKAGVIYGASSTSGDVFVHDIYRIIRTDTGWRWVHKNGEYKVYNETGRMLEWGTRTGVVGRILYDGGGRLVGIADRDHIQVIWYEYAGGEITAVRDAENRRVTYGYSSGRLTSVTDLTGGITRFEYDAEDRINKVIDPLNFTATVSYDAYGNVASVKDASGKGHVFEFDYDEAKKQPYVRIVDTDGKIREIWYDKEGDAIRVDVNGRTLERILKDGRNRILSDSKGDVTRKEYDEWENLTKTVYPDGRQVTYAYEHRFSRRVKEIDEREIITEYGYDDSGNMIRKTEAVGRTETRATDYTYDADGNQLSIKALGDSNTLEAITTMTYDGDGNVTTLLDPEGQITRFTDHDLMGNVLMKEDARGKVWTYEYDAAGRLQSTEDPGGNLTRFFYDAAGNKIRERDAEGNEKTFEYDQRRNLVKVTDALGNFTIFEYNLDGKLTKQTDPEGKIIRYQYDLDGRLIKTIDGNGNEIAMEYDALSSGCSSCSGGGGPDQVSRIIYPTFEKAFVYDARGRKTQEKDVLSAGEVYSTYFGYDPSGNLASKTDKESKTTHYVYDALNRLTKATDPLNQETLYVYDDRDNLIRLTDAEGNTTQFEYDRNNRLLNETRPMGEETAYTYDGIGNLIRKVDAKGQKTQYGYDDAGRLVAVLYFNPDDPVNPVKTVHFTFDRVGNLKTYEDGVTSGQYDYDNLYRKVSETVNYGTFSKGFRYSYYGNGLKHTFMDGSGTTYTYTYDSNNQLTGVQIPNQGSITVNAYTWNRPATITLPGGSRRDYDYDPLMRVKEITARDPTQNVLLNYLYTYDRMDNIASKDTEHGPYVYGYDDLYRLTAADNPVLSDEVYSYDGVGNRLTSTEATDWSYNPNNELEAYNGVSFVHDPNGNMIQQTEGTEVRRFIYNQEDRLIRVEDATGTIIASYYYDPFGRRLWKEVSGTRTYFQYADEGLVGEYDATGSEHKTYGYRPDSTWTTDPLFMKQGANYYFYHNDHLGTPQKMTAVNGAVVWASNYYAFGKTEVNPNSAIINNLRFPGQYYDSETDQHYNYHRYYYPRVGRYRTADPIGLEGGMNLFLYGENDPISMIDNFGLISYENAKNVPKYGKWCGPFYGGGKTLKLGEDPDWHVPPDDSLDECCYKHDRCYDINRVTADAAPDNCEKIKCDKELIVCLKGLPENPAIWPSPPKMTRNSKLSFPRLEPSEYTTARQYKVGAKVAFQAEQNRAKGKKCQ